MRTKKGIVSSAKMTGTVSVTVHRYVNHPIYKKRFRKSRKFLADVNGHDVHEGDTVLIGECKPMSKNKHFKVMEVLIAVPRVDDVKEEATLSDAINPEKVAPVIEKKEKKEEKTEEKAEEATDAPTEETTDEAPEASDEEPTPDAS